MSTLIVEEPEYRQGKSLLEVGGGTPASHLAFRTTHYLVANGVEDEWLGGIAGNYNAEAAELMERIPPQTSVRWPKKTLEGLPYGFRGDTTLCERTRHLWLPDYERAFEHYRRRSSSQGLVGGLVLEQLTDGGHLTHCFDIHRLSQEHFPEAFKLGLYWLPRNNRGAWRNLRRYPDFPDSLPDLPIVIAGNEFRRRIDEAVPILISTLIAAKWQTDRQQYSIIELFAQAASRHKLLGLAESHVDLPVIDVPVWQKARRWASGRAAGVAAPEVTRRVADLIVKVLQDDAKLIHGPNPDPREFSFIGVGGLPMPNSRDPQVRKAARQQFQETIEHLVGARLREMNQTLPPGLRIVWSSTVQRLPNRFVRIQASRVFPIPGKSARDYINEMLREDIPPTGENGPRRVA